MISRPPPRAPLHPSTRVDRSRQREARDALLERILDRARDDERVLAVLDYGSTSEGLGDAWPGTRAGEIRGLSAAATSDV